MTRSTLPAILASALLTFTLSVTVSAAERNVVYHIAEQDQVLRAIRNIANHLRADKGIHIEVVALGGGVEFLVDGAKDSRGNSYASMIDGMMINGVRFKACSNTMRTLSLTEDDMSLGVEVVPSGIAEITRLQLHKDFAYVRP